MKLEHAKQDPGKPLVEKHVNMSNALVRAAHSLSLGEKRIISSCIAKLDSTKSDGGFSKGVVRLSALEYAETFDIDPRTAYEQLKDAGDSLFHRYIRIVVDTPKGQKETKYRWVGDVTYHHGEGWIELGFTQKVAPHLVNLLKGEYTSYKLKQASALRSIYSWRLFELLTQYRGTGWLKIPIDDFAHALDVPESCRKDFFNLRKRVLEPAINELATKNNLIVQCEPQRSGRKVVALEFKFKADPQGRLPLGE